MTWGIWPRKADFTISRDGGVYMYRWYILPRNRWFNIYLHRLDMDDDPMALHDHPWWNVSVVLRGGYYEIMPMDPMTGYDAAYWASTASQHNTVFIREAKAERYQADKCLKVWRGPGSIVFRRATDAHRLELRMRAYHVEGRSIYAPSWSLFITGPVRRKWGFWKKSGWTPFDQVVIATPDGNRIKTKDE